ncbi:MBOAT family protein [Phenylobacterium aquaticum]|uniref:MBOAT family O-acyltransferase n=1 Tax=Phenylobacterium aquaticum TaxID=1763816 RepID=UPI0026F0DB15|nr:MBOAT family O-acyltransferase [Phenylobacterium aquaticum]
MIFNSITFVAFFATFLVVWSLPLGWTFRRLVLLAASYIFYASWSPPFVALLWISTLVDYFAARWIAREERPGPRRLALIISLAANLGMLGFFKYGGFLETNFQLLAGAMGFAYRAPHWNIVLPLGISFYTFQTLSYTLDVYQRRIAPSRSFLNFALFVTFFPHLVAGPIMRPRDLLSQFAHPKRANRAMLLWGLALMTLGLFEKIVLADSFLSGPADKVFNAKDALLPLDAWTGVLAFAGQIFFDFSGYTTTAIGAALCLGFSLPQNFNAPYAAVGFSDFWRRWHISLSTWLRDYLYISLGGNRKGRLRTYANLMITMLLGGLWHGANWTFVVWGGLHGFYLAVERVLTEAFGRFRVFHTLAFRLFAATLTFGLVCVAWVFFRAADFVGAARLLVSMASVPAKAEPLLYLNDILPVAAILSVMLLSQWRLRATSLEAVVARTPAVVLAVGWSLMAFLILASQGSDNAFIYFQF